MRTFLATLAFCALALPASAQQHQGHGGGGLPAGWHGRVDRATQKLEDVDFMKMGDGYHIVTGPHVILWDAELMGSGRFRATATYVQSKAPERLEGYGIIVGGRNLDQDTQDYLYFLIRHDGRFMVRHRAGTEVHTLADWTPADAIRKADAATAATNVVAIEADTNEVRFLVNDTQVYRLDRVPMLNTAGIVGLRIGHHLDLRVPNLLVRPLR